MKIRYMDKKSWCHMNTYFSQTVWYFQSCSHQNPKRHFVVWQTDLKISIKGQDEEEKKVLTLSHTWNYYKTLIITTEGIVTGSSNETEEKAPNRSTYIWIFDIDFLIGERMYLSINYLGTLGYPQVIKQNCISITHYI